MSEFSREFCIPATHPSLVGHFPGNPIVPGVVILDEVRLLLQQWHASARIKTFLQVKFLQPLLPEQIFSITLFQASPVLFKFECKNRAQKVVTGAFLIADEQ